MECLRVKCDPTEIQIINSFRAYECKEISLELEGTLDEPKASTAEFYKLIG